MADAKKKDPTVTSDSTGPAYPDGTHPLRSPSEVTHAGDRVEYRDNPDKPDPSSIAQLEVERDGV